MEARRAVHIGLARAVKGGRIALILETAVDLFLPLDTPY